MADMTPDRILQLWDAADKAGDVESAKFLAGEYKRASEGTADRGAKATQETRKGSVEGAGGAAFGVYPRAKSNAQPGGNNSFPAPLQLGAHVAKNAAGLAMFPGELIRAGANQLSGQPVDFGQGTKIMADAIDARIPPPKDKGGKLLTELVGGGALGAAFPGNMARNAITGTLSTAGGMIGGEAGQQMAGDNGRIIAGGIGALAGGLPSSAMKGKGDYKEMLANALKGVPASEVRGAQGVATAGQQRGVTLTPEQLFNQPTGLDNLINSVISSGAGSGKLQSILRQQPDEARALVEALANKQGGNVGNAAATRDLRLGAQGAVRDVDAPAGNANNFAFGNARVGGEQLEGIDQNLGKLADVYRGDKATLAQITSMRADLKRVSDTETFAFGSKTVLDKVEPGGPMKAAKHMPRQVPRDLEVTTGANPRDLDMVVNRIKADLDVLGLNTQGLDRVTIGRVSGATKEITRLLDELAPTRFAGRDIHASTQGRREDLTSSLTGRIAGRKGVSEPDPDPVGLLRNTLGSNRPQENEIAALAGALRDRASQARKDVPGALAEEATATAQYNQTAYAADLSRALKAGKRAENAGADAAQATRALPQAARSLFDEAKEATFGKGGQTTPPTAGKTFAENILGAPGSAKEKNFQATMRGVGQALGEDAAEYSAGMTTAIRLLEATGRNRGAVTPELVGHGRGALGQALASPAIAGALAGGNAAGAAGVVVGKGLASALDNTMYQRQYAKLAEIFSDPQAASIIAEMGRLPLVSSRQGALLTTLLTAGSQTAAQRAVARDHK